MTQATQRIGVELGGPVMLMCAHCSRQQEAQGGHLTWPLAQLDFGMFTRCGACGPTKPMFTTKTEVPCLMHAKVDIVGITDAARPYQRKDESPCIRPNERMERKPTTPCH